jgi:hypothetical protein
MVSGILRRPSDSGDRGKKAPMSAKGPFSASAGQCLLLLQ